MNDTIRWCFTCKMEPAPDNEKHDAYGVDLGCVAQVHDVAEALVFRAPIDYEAGNEALTRYLVFTEAMADYPFGDKNAIEGIVDAALGGNE